MDSTPQDENMPSKGLIYAGIIFCGISAVLTLLPFFTSWNNRQYIEISAKGGVNVSSNFYLGSEYNYVDTWQNFANGTSIH